MIFLVDIYHILDFIQRKMTNKEYDNLIIIYIPFICRKPIWF